MCKNTCFNTLNFIVLSTFLCHLWFGWGYAYLVGLFYKDQNIFYDIILKKEIQWKRLYGRQFVDCRVLKYRRQSRDAFYLTTLCHFNSRQQKNPIERCMWALKNTINEMVNCIFMFWYITRTRNIESNILTAFITSRMIFKTFW